MLYLVNVSGKVNFYRLIIRTNLFALRLPTIKEKRVYIKNEVELMDHICNVLF
jgi:hypothetical protein